jgi:hypothetical protein
MRYQSSSHFFWFLKINNQFSGSAGHSSTNFFSTILWRSLFFSSKVRGSPLILAAIAVIGVALSLGGAELFYGYGLSPYYVEFFAGALAYRVYDKTSSFYPEAQCAFAIALYFLVSALIDTHHAFSLPSLIQVFGFGLMGFLLISGMMGVDAK